MQDTKEYKEQINKLLEAYVDLTYILPNIIIGGSVAILAHGYKLNRLPKDLDIIIPFTEDEEVLNKIIASIYDKFPISSGSMSDFRLSFTHTPSEVSVDIGFFPDFNYKDIVFENRGIRILDLETILDFKFRYSHVSVFSRMGSSNSKKLILNAQKHWDDLQFLQTQGIEYISDEKFGSRPEIPVVVASSTRGNSPFNSSTRLTW